MTVVGVVGDVQEMALDTRVEPEVYLPSNQGRDVPRRSSGRSTSWSGPRAIRGRSRRAVREAVWSVDRDQAVSNLRTMDDIFEAELLSRNTQLTLVGAFALLALVMAAIGLYGVLAYTVAQRLPEIGIRVALGAARATVVVETLRNAMVLAAAGIALGLGVAVAVSRALRSWLFGVEPARRVRRLAGTAVPAVP